MVAIVNARVQRQFLSCGFVEYFCAAKPQKRDLKAVQCSEAERCCNALLCEALLCEKYVSSARDKAFSSKAPTQVSEAS